VRVQTALVKRVLQPHAMKRGFFISGKFDQLRKSEQSSAVKEAFQEFIQQLCNNSHNDDDVNSHQAARRREIRRIIEPIVFSEPLLLEMLPGLKELLGMTVDDDVDKHDHHHPDKSSSAYCVGRVRRPSIGSRLSHGFCRLIRSVCSPTRPLVLFLGMCVGVAVFTGCMQRPF
jgi:predicted ATPase